jgi:HAD superfamily hydrolase (TIGR01549 family)
VSIKAVLFDLDGTLLPMDMDAFVKAYFGLLAKKLAPLGYNSEKLISTIWAGTNAMVLNNGEKSNEAVFWDCFCSVFGKEALKDEPVFDEFYRTDFNKVKEVCGYNENANKTVKVLKEKGFRLVLATNPIFPAIATKNRSEWAGLDISDFEFFTTYENSCYCKPNTQYYNDILAKLNLNASECLMVGNDVNEDLIAESLGIKVFLLDDCIINKYGKDISKYNKGSFNELLEYIATLE